MTDRLTPLSVPDSNPTGCLLRIFWMGGGLILLLTAVVISGHKRVFFSIADLIFWGVVLLMIVARYIDVAYLAGETAMGNPATMQHWFRFVWLLLAFSLAVWAVAHVMTR